MGRTQICYQIKMIKGSFLQEENSFCSYRDNSNEACEEIKIVFTK